MKRMIVANSIKDELIEKLTDDLTESFEDNIIVKYAKYIDENPDFDNDRKEQEMIWSNFNKIKKQYIKAMADVIMYVGDDVLMGQYWSESNEYFV